MLPAGCRMRRREEFTSTVRSGGRAGRRHLVVHMVRRKDVDEPPRVGFIVARAVGGAVLRNRVRRRLRHLMCDRLDLLPRGSLLVVRANPKAATARYDELKADLDPVLDRLLRREVKEPI